MIILEILLKKWSVTIFDFDFNFFFYSFFTIGSQTHLTFAIQFISYWNFILEYLKYLYHLVLNLFTQIWLKQTSYVFLTHLSQQV